ncbi:MAG: tetratricopeptide repeat protein [bacterium]|nr:tetratricopeptide repeat protein [bacterium]
MHRFLTALVLASVALTTPAWAGNLREGVKLFGEGRYEAAIERLNEHAKRYPGDPRPHYYLMKSYGSSSRIDRTTIDQINAADRAYKRLSEAWNRRFLTLEGLEAMGIYRAMLDDDPTDRDARLLHAMALLQAGSPMMAEAEMQMLPFDEIASERRDAWYAARGLIAIAVRDWPTARKAFNDCKRANDRNPLWLPKLGEIERLARAQDEAEQARIFERRNQTEDQQVQLALQLGKDLLAEKNFDGAIEALNQALALSPDQPEAKALLVEAQSRGAELAYQRGVEFMRAQKYAAAYDAFSAALKLNPRFLRARLAAQDAKTRADRQGADVD